MAIRKNSKRERGERWGCVLLGILVLLVELSVFAGKPPGGGSTGWRKADTNLSRWTFSTLPAPEPGDIATCPITTTYANYTAFIVTNKSQNIAGKTITAVFTVESTSGDPSYVWGGYNVPGGGYGTVAEAGLYFSTDTGFPRNGAPPASDSDNYWYTPFDRVEVHDLLGTVSLSVAVIPENWSDAYGGWGANNVAGFANACQGGGVFGVALGSNQFFDTGVATVNGTAVLHLHSFSVQ